MHFEKLINSAVPRFVVFRERRDRLIVERDGDATLDWRFTLTAPRDVAIQTLTFPIYVDIDADAPDTNRIEVQSVKVNRVDIGNDFELERRELRTSMIRGRPSMQYSVLRVPVELGEGQDVCDLRIVLKMIGVFPAGVEKFYVDIPYLTEKLRVTLVTAAGKVRRPLNDATTTIEAMSGLMEVPDPAESKIQSDHCTHDGAWLVWKAEAPKLGYQYKMSFRLDAD